MRSTLTAIAASLLLALPVHAEEAHHPDQKNDAVPAAKISAQPLQQMQDNVKKMDAQLKRIAKEKNEAERSRLLGEHMLTMRENMMMLSSGIASGCPMTGSGMVMMMGSGMGAMMGPGAGMGPNEMMERMQHMENRLNMMQMMMEQREKALPIPAPSK